jgi:DNA (cytosine-5)-methyltransferase 1
MPMGLVRAIDLFCGAGGSSWGARKAGAAIVAGFDVWGLAARTFRVNFPEATCFESRIETVDPVRIRRDIGGIDLILASPECTNHTHAKGAAPRNERSRETALHLLRFAKAFEPRWIVIENVVGMRRWHRYAGFISKLKSLGYFVGEHVLDAADFGVPQSRRRLLILCDRDVEPRLRLPARQRRFARCIVRFGRYPTSDLRAPRRAAPTLERARRAIAEVGAQSPFLIVYYGTDQAGGWQRLDQPLRTVTTLDRFALVVPGRGGHEMRMLQVPELKSAMGMPAAFQTPFGTRRDQIKLLGNAVCPPVMQAAVSALIRASGGRPASFQGARTPASHRREGQVVAATGSRVHASPR